MMKVCDTCGREAQIIEKYKVCAQCVATYNFINLTDQTKEKKVKAVENILKNKKLKAWPRRYWTKVLYSISPFNKQLFVSKQHISPIKPRLRLDSKNYWKE